MVKKFLTSKHMRRSLVLTDERARHPFRASLPPHVRQGMKPARIKRRGWFDLSGFRIFLGAYCLCFIATSLYIA